MRFYTMLHYFTISFKNLDSTDIESHKFLSKVKLKEKFLLVKINLEKFMQTSLSITNTQD